MDNSLSNDANGLDFRNCFALTFGLQRIRPLASEDVFGAGL
jgi:hypothetical protein